MTHPWHGIDPLSLCPTHRWREYNELKQLGAILRGEWSFNGEWHYAKIIGHVEEGQVLLDHVNDRLCVVARALAREHELVPVVPEIEVPFKHYRLDPEDVAEYNRLTLERKSREQDCGCDPRIMDDPV